MLDLVMEFKAMKWRSSMSLILLLAAMLFSSGIPKQEVMIRKTTPKSLIVSKDILQMYDKQIRSYYLSLKEVSDGGILSFPNKAQVEYTDVAVELLNAALRSCSLESLSLRVVTMQSVCYKLRVCNVTSLISLITFGSVLFIFQSITIL